MAFHRLTVVLARCVLAFGSLFVAVVLLGPFQGAERNLMLTDKQAHGLAFFIFTLVSFAAAPRIRRGDLVLTALGLAAASEIAQALVGRDGNIADFKADGIGILVAAGLWTAIRFWRTPRAPTLRRRRGDTHPEIAVVGV
jgi:hypothetical protein